MRKREFWWASLVLVVLGVCVHFGALSQWAKSTSHRARALGVDEDQRQQMYAEADGFVRIGSILGYVGLGLAVGSTVCLAVSIRRKEQAWHLVPIGLLVVYLFLQFLMV